MVFVLIIYFNFCRNLTKFLENSRGWNRSRLLVQNYKILNFKISMSVTHLLVSVLCS